MMRVVQGGPWHGSQAEKEKNHGSRISKIHFHENKQITYSFFLLLRKEKRQRRIV